MSGQSTELLNIQYIRGGGGGGGTRYSAHVKTMLRHRVQACVMYTELTDLQRITMSETLGQKQT